MLGHDAALVRNTASTTAPGAPVNAAPPVTFISAGQSMGTIFRTVVSVAVWTLTRLSKTLFKLAQTA